MLNDNIPEEVVIDILSQLPADTLVRFKCVCKSWYALIESPEFKTMQCNKYVHSPSSNKNSCLYLLVKNWDLTSTGKEGNILSLLAYDDRMLATFDGENVSFAVKNVELPFFKYTGFSISGHCDGIICLYAVIGRPTVILANPGIREFRALPESCIPLSGQNKYQCYSVTVGVGLGFDLRTNDYKVVRILEFFSPRGSPKGVIEAEVYSLRSNSWRQIEYLDPYAHILNVEYNSFLCYWNGAYYWPAVARNQQDDLVYGIISFDLSDEAFQFIPLPKFVSLHHFHSYPKFSIFELNETLALAAYPNCRIENCEWRMEQQFDIWVMDELGISETWTKLLSTGPLLGVEKPIGFWKSDELLVILSSGQAASYNIVTNQMKNLPINGEALYIEAVIYKSSLVSVINY